MPARLHSRETVLLRLGEVFREHGYEGASLAHITKATELGKGSLYHAFPNGKADMAKAVLANIDAWFKAHVFQPLGDETVASMPAVEHMLDACDEYFHGGGRVCLVGVFALGETRDQFHLAVNGYFLRWLKALVAALGRGGLSKAQCREQAEHILAGIQGALVIARALDDTAVFTRELARLKSGLRVALSA